MKKVFSLTLSLLMLVGMFSINAFAADTTSAADATVYVTIANKGSLVVTQEAVTVTDIDEDGKLTIDEALYAVHEAKYEGGADAGYASAVSEYGISMTMLWGDTSGSFGYYVNNASVWSLADEVKEGDYVNAFVYADQTNWSDTYCFFDMNTFDAEVGEKLTLTLSAASYDAEYNPIAVFVEGAVITLNGEKTEYKTDAEGKVTITLDKAGDVVIGATCESMTLVPPVCKVNVTVKAQETTPETGPETDNGSTTGEPKNNGCGSVIAISAVSVVAVAAAAGFICFKKKRRLMKLRFSVGLLCCLILLSCIGVLSVTAEANENTADKAESFISGIVAYQQNNQNNPNIQDWIDGSLVDNARISSEWYILALSQYGDYDFSAYEQALLAYLAENDAASASSRQKYALCLAAVGSTDRYISSVMNNSIGEQGIMSLVYGLHLLNNGYTSAEHTTDSVIAELLSMQLSDGGFAIYGEYGDNDATAMTVQALAPHYENKSEVKNAVDKALELLSKRQGENGDYSSYGVYNPESTAQVLVALSSLGIDCTTDARFIKNGNTLFDGIEQYRLQGGSFCHKIGGESNGTATVQVFYSMVSYLRMKDGKSPLYILDRADPENAEPAPDVPNDTDNKGEGESEQPTTSSETETPNTDIAPSKPQKADYKPWAILVILSLGALSALIFFILKKRNYKNYIAIMLVVAIGITIVLVTDFRSAEDYYNGQDSPKENVIGQVTMTIRCDTVVGRSDSEYIPDDGVILAVTEFDIAEGETAYDILVEATRKYSIQMENKGSAEMAYIAGINYLYEFDHGDLSGWVYRVNGTQPSVGCGEYKLKDGDKIEWHYTFNLGKDIE